MCLECNGMFVEFQHSNICDSAQIMNMCLECNGMFVECNACVLDAAFQHCIFLWCPFSFPCFCCAYIVFVFFHSSCTISVGRSTTMAVVGSTSSDRPGGLGGGWWLRGGGVVVVVARGEGSWWRLRLPAQTW